MRHSKFHSGLTLSFLFLQTFSFIKFIDTDMERAITRDLVSHILLFSEHLLKAVNFAAELDW